MKTKQRASQEKLSQLKRKFRHRLTLEFCVLFFAAPLLVIIGPLPNWPIPVLLLSCSMVIIYLRKHTVFFEWEKFTNWEQARPLVGRITLRFFVLSGLLVLLVLLHAPESLFVFPRNAPDKWVALLIIYPALSVIPQEFIFRVFIFERYKIIFETKQDRIIASAFAFGFVHLVYGAWLSVALSFVGGLLFGQTYAKSRSLLLVAYEHSLYGMFIFTVGLGRYFYHATN